MFSDYLVRPTELTTARQLYDVLDENNSIWGHGDWIFRGQPDASKPLLPTALRPEFMQKYVAPEAEQRKHEYIRWQKEMGYPFVNSNVNSDEELHRYFYLVTHIAVERCIVWAFERLADRAALDVPNERASFWGGNARSSLNDEFAKILKEKPREQKFLPNQIIFALARHHTLPVRMLDWTVRPHNAAFFAADPIESCGKNSNHLVVWAVDRSTLEESTSLRLFAPLRTPIGFLRSQEGLFMYDLKANEKFMEDGNWQPFDNQFYDFPHLKHAYKFLLPCEERIELLRLLLSKGISKSTLMPSYDNVAMEITTGRIDWKRVLMDSK